MKGIGALQEAHFRRVAKEGARGRSSQRNLTQTLAWLKGEDHNSGQPRLRRIRGYRHLPLLRAALQTEIGRTKKSKVIAVA